MRTRWAAAFTLCALAACGASPNTPNGPVVGSGGHAPPSTPLVNVKLTVTISPEHGDARRMRRNYISPDTKSLGIQLASVDGAGVTGVNASVVDTAPASPHCKAQGGATVCTANISGSPGSDVFTVTTYADLNATGAVLSVGTVSAHVQADSGLRISNALSLDVNGVIAGLKLAVSPNRAKRGEASASAVTLVAYDAAGAQIVGPSDFQAPVALTIQGDATQSYALHNGATSGPSLNVEKPASGITLTYDGNKNASSITIQANVTDADPVSVKAPFTLRGHQPPPPVGTIYVLNLGKKDGLGATVTEYDGKANGDVAPLRTLDLSTKLYARSIVVDGNGNLYVGYFDSSLGYNPSNGSPIAGNVVAIFAPGASGNDPPAATLQADSGSNTTLFPLFSAIDGSGGLVTYGATSVDGNAGDAILTYASGASGSAAPLHGLDFASPAINYAGAGPTGLALDASGNVYFAGSLKSALGPSFGIFIAAAGDIGNPSASPARTIPWDSSTELTAGDTTNVGLDTTGEVVVANSLVQFSGSHASCQARANVYAAGASGGITDAPPLRVLTLAGISTNNSDCASSRSPLQPFFPEIALSGTTLFAVDDFNNAVDAFPSGSGGTVAPSQHIAGSATGLDAPIAVYPSSFSDRATARPVKNGRTPQ